MLGMSCYCWEKEKLVSPRENPGPSWESNPRPPECHSYHYSKPLEPVAEEWKILSIGLSRIQLILSLGVEIPCGQGSGPGWIDCTAILPERILSTTSQASGSITSNTDWIGISTSTCKPTYPIVTVVCQAVTISQAGYRQVMTMGY